MNNKRPNRSEYQSHKEWSNTTRTPVIIRMSSPRRRADDVLPWKVVTFLALAAAIAFASLLLLFGN